MVTVNTTKPKAKSAKPGAKSSSTKKSASKISKTVAPGAQKRKAITAAAADPDPTPSPSPKRRKISADNEIRDLGSSTKAPAIKYGHHKLKVIQTKDKGRGLAFVSYDPIKKPTLTQGDAALYDDKPIITLRKRSEENEKTLRDKFQSLTRADKLKFAHLPWGEAEVKKKSQLNTQNTVWHRWVDNSTDYLNVFYGSNLINHSCLPNGILLSDPDKETVINIGPLPDSNKNHQTKNEISISYLNPAQLLWPADERRAKLKAVNGFHCVCQPCRDYDKGQNRDQAGSLEWKRDRLWDYVVKYHLDLLDSLEDQPASKDPFFTIDPLNDMENVRKAQQEVEEAIELAKDLLLFEYLRNAYALAIYLFSHEIDAKTRQLKLLIYSKALRRLCKRFTYLNWDKKNKPRRALLFLMPENLVELHVACLMFAEARDMKNIHPGIAKLRANSKKTCASFYKKAKAQYGDLSDTEESATSSEADDDEEEVSDSDDDEEEEENEDEANQQGSNSSQVDAQDDEEDEVIVPVLEPKKKKKARPSAYTKKLYRVKAGRKGAKNRAKKGVAA